jgi:RNA polymerase sigma-70 factor (ECF subfamily)
MVGVSQLTLIPGMSIEVFATDTDLLAGCRRRDVRAFEQVYQAHASRLKSIAFHMTRNRQDAEDAVQETFLKLYRAIDGFHGQSAIGTWLCRILINVCYDLQRKRRREADPEEQQQAPEQASGGEPTLAVALRQALDRINPRHRLVFLLFEVEGMRHSEIASILETPEGTCRAWLFEAKKELKRMLSEARP